MSKQNDFDKVVPACERRHRWEPFCAVVVVDFKLKEKESKDQLAPQANSDKLSERWFSSLVPQEMERSQTQWITIWLEPFNC